MDVHHLLPSASALHKNFGHNLVTILCLPCNLLFVSPFIIRASEGLLTPRPPDKISCLRMFIQGSYITDRIEWRKDPEKGCSKGKEYPQGIDLETDIKPRKEGYDRTLYDLAVKYRWKHRDDQTKFGKRGQDRPRFPQVWFIVEYNYKGNGTERYDHCQKRYGWINCFHC